MILFDHKHLIKYTPLFTVKRHTVGYLKKQKV